MKPDLQEIKQRYEKATHGEWTYTEGNDGIMSEGQFFYITSGGYSKGVGSESDLDFIAHAHQDIPHLIKKIEKLEAVITAIKEIRKPILDAITGCAMMEGAGEIPLGSISQILVDIGTSIDEALDKEKNE